MPRCFVQSSAASGVLSGTIFSDKTLIDKNYLSIINTSYRSASFQVCVLPTGPITGVRIGIADYASVAGNTPLPNEILGLTRIGTMYTAGT